MAIKEKHNSFLIKYPKVSAGTEKTKVTFYDKEPDLVSLFYGQEGKNSFESSTRSPDANSSRLQPELFASPLAEENSTPASSSGKENDKKKSRRRCFVTDASVASLPCMKSFTALFEDGKFEQDILLILGSGEAYKTIESALSIVEFALESGFSRNDLFVGIGGGVISDITGFAASLYKRGAAVQFVPTTLLSMVDAAIGGKTGVDFKSYKNMVGTFFPAEEIHYFPNFTKSLSDEQFRSGLAEGFKTALLYDKELYEIFKNESERIIARDEKLIFDIIQRSAKIKATVVEEDLTEKNIRKFLNLGHTFAHALETVAGLGTMTHGDAVAWGIGRMATLCARLEICSEGYKDEVLSILEKYGWNITPYPDHVTGGGIGERLVNVMHKDKKNASSKITLVLQRGLNDTFIEEIDDTEILKVLK